MMTKTIIMKLMMEMAKNFNVGTWPSNQSYDWISLYELRDDFPNS